MTDKLFNIACQANFKDKGEGFPLGYSPRAIVFGARRIPRSGKPRQSARLLMSLLFAACPSKRCAAGYGALFEGRNPYGKKLANFNIYFPRPVSYGTRKINKIRRNNMKNSFFGKNAKNTKSGFAAGKALPRKFWLIAFCALAAIAVLIFLSSVMFDVFGCGVDKKVGITVPEGASVTETAKILKENGVIKYETVFRIYEKLNGKGGTIQSGKHYLNVSDSYEEILKTLCSKSEEYKMITIPEGYELRQIAALLEENKITSAAEFLAEAQNGNFEEFEYIKTLKNRENRLEGYLFPDTYEFKTGTAAHSVILTMLKNFDNKVYSYYKESGTTKSLDELVKMASIVEREAAGESERGKVASVFYNRLKIGKKLESCATVQYILGERKTILSVSDISIDSPYNTYKYNGLPIGPISSFGISSFKAAVNPEKTDYYYFAATKDGSKNVFSKTGEEHMKKVKELQK